MANSTLAITRSTIGIPLGDIAGIGPEIVVMALAQPAVCQTAKPLVIGEANALRRALRIAGLNLEIHPITDPAQGHYRHGIRTFAQPVNSSYPRKRVSLFSGLLDSRLRGMTESESPGND
jgi:4-hydroxy-L-threonine phosphate dehydrogenase PdxA